METDIRGTSNSSVGEDNKLILQTETDNFT
jgi:hypothetical protein